jgi:hypothetical protein
MRDLDVLAVYIAQDSERAAEFVEGCIRDEARLLSRFHAQVVPAVSRERANAWSSGHHTFLPTGLLRERSALSGSTTELEGGPSTSLWSEWIRVRSIPLL